MSGGTCELCRRSVQRLTRHHLIPRTRHANRRTRKTFSRDEVHGRVAWLCRPCHKQIHAVLDAKQLEREFNTIERLLSHPELARFVDWIRTRPDGTSVRSVRWGRHPGGRRSGPR